MIEMINKRFNRLLVLKDSGKRRSKRGGIIWSCLCDCGKEVEVRGDHLRGNYIKSCGCLNREIVSKQKTRLTHGKTKTPIYNIWRGIIERCCNKDSGVYKYYGGRGIFICESWKQFENFYKDMGDKPNNMSIDRINNNDGYYKENCRWSTMKEQSNNRRSCVIIELDGIKMNMKQWSEKYNISNKTIHKRIKDGWSIEDAIKTPTRRIK